MEAALLDPSWTQAVPWARPWRTRSVQRPPLLSAPKHVAITEPNSRLAESEWQAATAALAAARAELAALDAAEDEWPVMMARHAVHLAMRRVRAAQQALGGDDAQWIP
jgi:hypothetical protein